MRRFLIFVILSAVVAIGLQLSSIEVASQQLAIDKGGTPNSHSLTPDSTNTPKPTEPAPTASGSTTPATTPTLPPPPTPSSVSGSNSGSSSSNGIKAGVIITLTPPLNISLGDVFTLAGSIRDWSGAPVANGGILFYINGAYLGQTRSDANGNFTQNFNRPFNSGIYSITATFNGTHLLSYASSATTLNVQPANVTVQTVPPVAGVTFALNGTQFVTGEDGSATIKVNQAGTYHLEALTNLYNDPNQHIEFGRWLEDLYQPYKDITVPTNGPIQAGLNIYNLVGQTFIGLDGQPVDPSRITDFTIRSEQGDTFIFNNGDPRWIPSSRITRRVNGLIQTKMLYSVLSVKLDGSNVVNASQQQFYAEPNDNWKISLLLYSLGVKVEDGLFGSAAGKSINLIYPNGQVKNFALDKDGFVQIHSLARGNYNVEVIGARGLGNKMPVALSRNQNADMKVLTYVDVGIIGIMGLFVAVALFLFGRRRLVQRMLRNNQQQPVPSASNAVLDVNEILPADGKGTPPKDEAIKWS